jgi:Ca2+-binding RTX toxin-like protein
VVRIRDVRFDLCALDLAEPVIPAEVIQYTLTDSDGDTSTSTLTLNVITNHLAGTDAANDTIAGTGANDAIAGLAGNDVLSGLAGNDLITGGDGSDTIDGGADDDTLAGGEGNDAITGGSGKDTLRGDAGNDTLDGGTGDDTLDGGAGNDVIIGGDGIDSILGGAGSDTLTGGIGADVFKWELADRGTKGTPAVDTITDFDPALPGAGGDVLDLRDLLAGESHPTGTGNLASFLHFETAGSDTKVHISSTGGFLAGYAPGQEDQTILLQNVDLIGSFSTDQQIIQDLLNKGKLITD